MLIIIKILKTQNDYSFYFKNGSLVKILGRNYLSADATEQHEGGFRDFYFYPNADVYRKNNKR